MQSGPSSRRSFGRGQGFSRSQNLIHHMPVDFQEVHEMTESAWREREMFRSNVLRIRGLEHSLTYYPQLVSPEFWDHRPNRPQQTATQLRPAFNTAPDEIPSRRAIWFPYRGVLSIKLSHLIHHSKLASWLNSFNQLHVQTPGYKLLKIQSPVIPTLDDEQGDTEAMYMRFDDDAFTLALAFLAQASYSHPYTTLNPLEFVRAMAYFQPHSLPIEIMVAMLHRSNVAQWSNFYVLARTFFPKDRRLIMVLKNYNLWHVRISIERLRELGTCPNVLLQAARDYHALFRRYVNRVQPGRCIVCEADIDCDALLSPLRLGQFYMTSAVHTLRTSTAGCPFHRTTTHAAFVGNTTSRAIGASSLCPRFHPQEFLAPMPVGLHRIGPELPFHGWLL